MSRLYKRIVALTLARPVAGEFFRQQPNAIVVRDLRVQFSITKSLAQEPNTCDITISNMAAQTRAEVQIKPLHVTLEAGYDGTTERLFTGDMRHASSRKEGVEWETKIQIADGDRAYRNARVSRSFRSGVDRRTVLEETAKAMGLRIPKNVDDAKAMVDDFAAGVTLQGPSSREMERLLAPTGMSWSIQDGNLQILREGELRPGTAIVVSQDTGLVGTPELGAPTEPGKPPVLTFRMLLYPGLTPGARARMQSLQIRGDFRAQKVTHTGDTHGADWFTDVEAVPAR